MADEFDLEEEERFDFDDEFDRLREKTARTSAVYDELEEDEAIIVENEGFFSQISPIQRLILAVLLLLDIVVIVIGGLVVFGII